MATREQRAVMAAAGGAGIDDFNRLQREVSELAALEESTRMTLRHLQRMRSDLDQVLLGGEREDWGWSAGTRAWADAAATAASLLFCSLVVLREVRAEMREMRQRMRSQRRLEEATTVAATAATTVDSARASGDAPPTDLTSELRGLQPREQVSVLRAERLRLLREIAAARAEADMRRRLLRNMTGGETYQRHSTVYTREHSYEALYRSNQSAPEAYTEEQYSNQHYSTEPEYPVTEYAEQHYAEQQYPEQQYTTQQYTEQPYAEQVYPEQNEYAEAVYSSESPYAQFEVVVSTGPYHEGVAAATIRGDSEVADIYSISEMEDNVEMDDDEDEDDDERLDDDDEEARGETSEEAEDEDARAGGGRAVDDSEDDGALPDAREPVEDDGEDEGAEEDEERGREGEERIGNEEGYAAVVEAGYEAPDAAEYIAQEPCRSGPTPDIGDTLQATPIDGSQGNGDNGDENNLVWADASAGELDPAGANIGVGGGAMPDMPDVP